MNKSIISLVSAAMLLGTTILLAETGVVIHEKDGSTTFYPSATLDYVEFVEDYAGDEEDPSNPGGDENPSEAPFNIYNSEKIQLNKTYLLVSNGVCAGAVEASHSYGYLPSAEVVLANDDKEAYTEIYNGFEFAKSCKIDGKTYDAPSDKFLIKDGNGRYLYLQGTYSSFNLSIEPSLSSGNNIADNYLFSAIKNEDGTWVIQNTKNNDTRMICYSSSYNNFAAYNYLSSSDSYPYLYLLDDNYVPDEDNSESNVDVDKIEGYDYPFAYVKLPEGTSQQVKEYTGFTVNFNKDNHTPNYVAWELLATETNGSENRNDYNYWVDKELDGCLDIDYAYSSTGYERGHMCPAADQKWSSSAMKDCMVMSNMCPQLRSLNAGIWETLEDKEREWAKRDGKIWIIAGPIYYESDYQYIGKSQARVPSAFFKAFLFNDAQNPRAIAFAFTNGSNPGNIEDYAMSIDDLEKELGYDLFSALRDDVENSIEATYSFSDWNK